VFNTIPDYYRKLSVESLFSTPTVKNCWDIWKQSINDILTTRFNETDIINIGDHLSNIFQTTGGDGREQGSLSGGGVAWESLVCWYINLCTVGSRVVAVRKMSLVPKPIQNAITVNYGNFACNTESDITVIVFPNFPEYNSPIDELNFLDSQGVAVNNFHKTLLNPELMDLLCARDFNNYEIGIIQCKTNWNDNAQIPMLWDMIYSANGFRGRNITIGREGYNIHQSNNFTYSFVTVPSNRRDLYSQDSVSVKRVTNLSGGNYWGKPTAPNIARSLKEIFINNYLSGYRTDIRNDIKKAIPFLSTELKYFNLI